MRLDQMVTPCPRRASATATCDPRNLVAPVKGTFSVSILAQQTAGALLTAVVAGL